MNEEMVTSVNTEEVAEPQNTEENVIETQEENQEVQTEETTTEPTENVEEQSENTEENKNVQTPEENAAFAKVRREAEQRGRDAAFAAMGMTWRGQPITTEAEYYQAVREKQIIEEAQKNNQNPEDALRLDKLEKEALEYRREKEFSQQERALLEDEDLSPIYNENKDDIRKIMDEGACSLDTAFTLFIKDNFKSLLKKAREDSEQATIKNLQKNQSSTPGSLTDESNNSSKINFDKMSDSEFEKYVEGVKSGVIK